MAHFLDSLRNIGKLFGQLTNMKTPFLLLFLLPAMWMSFSAPTDNGHAQPEEDIQRINDMVKDILEAFETGNHQKLGSIFNSTVEISTPSHQGVYSKAQAERVIQRFFRQNKSENVKEIHRGDANAGSGFVILSYVTGTDTFRITVFFKSISSEPKIQEIDIIKQI
jgi:hypothetical protein